ncbi:hypothetical protein [Anaerocolumna xylanovorans]|uniref:Lipoprotein n=1 Tax=Anaerocolumna xylanovorans DSM 12503 TaxID=1121345 RepID=A0A1M7Y0J6_9FIRM|nr:hypothetical protein [Anaerocolumna xylanovorans]SHO45080.1 hypothetical protein SAMN02745217_00817 [Anaerocolumna xylanovorans DSM 12503]
MKKLFLTFFILLIANLSIGCNSKENPLSKGDGATYEVTGHIQSEEETGKNNCNPYEYVTEYIPMQIPRIITQDDTVIFEQICNVDADTDKIVDNLYQEYSSDLSLGIKDCYPEFDKDKVSFSRVAEDDYERYQLYLNYIGNNGIDLPLNLNNMPENRYTSLGCTTFQKDSDVELALLSVTLYSNVEVNVLLSRDFSGIQSVYENNTYQELVDLLNSENASVMGGINMANVYHYQQRIFRKDTDSTTEEQIIYYTYLKKGELEYIIQYKSNYTVMEGQKAYMTASDLHSQEECRNILLSVLKIIVNS